MVIMPAYNEQASLRKVVTEWFREVENWTEKFVFLVINDGSTDGTKEILERLQLQLDGRLECIHQENRGHGQSCLVGYREATERSIPYVFQVDSDGQCDPQYFFRFWREREKYHVVYGRRAKRDDGWRRVLGTALLRMTLLAVTGVLCVDANVPYRLMRVGAVSKLLPRIPKSFFLANVALAVLLGKNESVSEKAISIRFRERYGGEPKVKIEAFFGKAVELVSQLRTLKLS
jgi:glycosyltransferase involved in cell wall biosynthesis